VNNRLNDAQIRFDDEYMIKNSKEGDMESYMRSGAKRDDEKSR